MSDDPPADSFDYGERRDDGQYERHPTTDEGEFVQPVRKKYVHDECYGTTTMADHIAQSFARDPTQYHKTFCATCKDYYPLDEFTWKGTQIRVSTVGETEDHEEEP
jgi:hypothetical protein